MERATRRGLLAAAGSGAFATAGCLRRTRAVAGWDAPEQVSFRIRTVPADADPYALELARRVADWFTTAGIDTTVVPASRQEVARKTLLEREFDLFVGRLPGRVRRPDALYELCHSTYVNAAGWQNPFGYTNLTVDDLLTRQRTADGQRRREAVRRVQTTLAETQPFTVLAFPDEIRAAGSADYTGWESVGLDSPLGLFSLQSAGEESQTLRLVTTDARATVNLNPLAVEFRSTGVVTGSLYDPLGYVVGDRLLPWLAADWTFTGSDPPVAEIELRPDARWHDGEAITARDAAFTYRLLADTTLGDGGDRPAVPAPRFRAAAELVAGTTVLDERTLRVSFTDCAPAVAGRALTAPILPAHVWRDRTESASIAGVDFDAVTDALVTSNVPPVGSGPLRYEGNDPRKRLVLRRFEDHFLTNEPRTGLPARVGPPPFDRLEIRAVGSDEAAVGVVQSGEAGSMLTPAGSGVVPAIGRADDLQLVVERAGGPYVLGYNARRPHLTNPQVRNTLARLIDEARLVADVLDGYGAPAVGPLADTEWYPQALEWDGSNPVVPFLGSDGQLDTDRVRAAFREIGYRYDEERLVGGER